MVMKLKYPIRIAYVVMNRQFTLAVYYKSSPCTVVVHSQSVPFNPERLERHLILLTMYIRSSGSCMCYNLVYCVKTSLFNKIIIKVLATEYFYFSLLCTQGHFASCWFVPSLLSSSLQCKTYALLCAVLKCFSYFFRSLFCQSLVQLVKNNSMATYNANRDSFRV